MYRVGLTGGIGSGKSTVAHWFSALGVPVIDADDIAHELVVPGAPALARIAQLFGGEVLEAGGALDRAALRRIVFADAARRKQLEAILHPLIRAEMEARVERLAAAYCVLCIPLLLETGQAREVERVLVVDAPHALQYQRLMARGLGVAEIAAILRVQAGWRERLAAAHDVIENDRDLDHVEKRVRALHESYLQLARAGRK
ncbi:MAG: dephospho-CoA kinase [Gammaproteobacteria bacterium]|nr:dephospho-CoA kinase [Gammaproteobacteria bacterium]